MKVSLLTPNLSANCVGRVALLARILARRFDVEIVGPLFGGDIWGPLGQEGLPWRGVPVGESLPALPRLRDLADLADGDVLFASKPLAASLGVGLLARGSRRRPLLLDIDDWEWGFAREAWDGLDWLRRLRLLASSTWKIHANHSVWNVAGFERLVGRCDGRTVSNRWLQQRFGGEIVWHSRDTRAFRPGAVDGAAARRHHGLDADARIVMYLGTLRPHKGVEDLVDAVGGLPAPGALLVLVGVGTDAYASNLVRESRKRLGTRLVSFGEQPFGKVPEFLEMADVVAIPQRRSRATVGQMPAKLFDAMALARPVVATDVSDVAEVLGDAGWVVEPDSPASLAAALGEALGDRRVAAERARRARRRCEERYSHDAMEPVLNALVEEALQRSRANPR